MFVFIYVLKKKKKTERCDNITSCDYDEVYEQRTRVVKCDI